MGVFKQFAGFDNYVRVLKDRSFQTAIQNTFIYVLLASPVSILIALLLALIAAQKRTMSTLWTRAEFRKTYTDRRYIAILMNKYIFSKVFADFYGRRCVQASAVDAALLESLAGDCGKVVYKPNCKGQGTGVRILPAVTEAEQADTLA